jgi:adenylate kinase
MAQEIKKENLPNTVLVIGPSGSGKDTQIDKLVEKFNYEKIGTGDMFREMYAQGDPDGIKAHEYCEKGVWVPDDLVYSMFAKWIKRYDQDKKWIFSQVVRTEDQVEMFDNLLQKFDRELDLVIYFSLSDEAAIERMSLRRYCPQCGEEYHLKYVPPKKEGVCDNDGTQLEVRDDDHPEAIKQRIKEFRNKTEPILEVYRNRDLLVEIDASETIEEIHEVVLEKLSKE